MSSTSSFDAWQGGKKNSRDQQFYQEISTQLSPFNPPMGDVVIINRQSNQQLPLAIGNIVGDFECLDLITPNRLLLRRNNVRCQSGIMNCTNPTNVIKENQAIFNSWFEVWLLVHVPKLMHQQMWFSSDNINVGDVIMFTKSDSVISNSYTYGIVKSLEFGRDGVARKATVRYRNENERVFRETKRAVRSLVIIHHVDDVDMMKELGLMAMYCDSIYKTNK